MWHRRLLHGGARGSWGLLMAGGPHRRDYERRRRCGGGIAPHGDDQKDKESENAVAP